MLLAGFATRFRTDYAWPEWFDADAFNAECGVYTNGELVHPCEYPPYPSPEEEGYAGFVMRPGLGLRVDLWRRVSMRVAADAPILANSAQVVLAPRLSARVIVTLMR